MGVKPFNINNIETKHFYTISVNETKYEILSEEDYRSAIRARYIKVLGRLKWHKNNKGLSFPSSREYSPSRPEISIYQGRKRRNSS